MLRTHSTVRTKIVTITKQVCEINEKTVIIIIRYVFFSVLGEDDQFISELRATKHECTTDKEVLVNVAVPVMDSCHREGLQEGLDQLACSDKDYYEWLGAVSCGVDM